MRVPLTVKKEGLYCTAGDFYIDAWLPVPVCVVTHGHGDHARYGHQHYIASSDSVEILHHRLGKDISLQCLKYGEKLKKGNAWISLHPAGHILGSVQVRIETPEGVTVVSGDYKREKDPTCLPFEVVPCDCFATESTFALPIYRWEKSEVTAAKIYKWWQENSVQDAPSVLFCYALGKAQRVLALLAQLTSQPIYLHGAIYPLADIYAKKGISIGQFLPVSEKEKKGSFAKDLILAPPSAAGSLWLKRFPGFRTALASGWMQVRGMRRRKNMDQGFVLSDHADWDGLIATIKETQAAQILTAHGNTAVLAKYLFEVNGIKACELKGLEIASEGEE